MAYDEDSFLTGLAVGRNMKSWPSMEDATVSVFIFTVQFDTQHQNPMPLEIGSCVFHGVVFWGDGQSEQVDVSGSLSHIYAYDEAYDGTYQVFMVGQFGRNRSLAFTFSDSISRPNHAVISIDSPLPLPYDVIMGNQEPYCDIGGVCLGCTKLESVSNGFFELYEKDGIYVEGMSSIFTGCESLINFPNFYRVKFKARPEPRYWVSLADAFRGCKLMQNFPQGLFSNPTIKNVQDMSRIFADCENLLADISHYTLKNCTGVTDLTSAFRNTATRSIDAGAFTDMQALQSLDSAFAECSRLIDVDGPLFSFGSETLTGVASCFRDCPSLSSVGPLFAGCANIRNADWCFRYDRALVSADNLVFGTVQDEANFGQAFYYCEALSHAPELWLSNPTARGYGCFWYCNSVDNYADIPSSWGGPTVP